MNVVKDFCTYSARSNFINIPFSSDKGKQPRKKKIYAQRQDNKLLHTFQFLPHKFLLCLSSQIIRWVEVKNGGRYQRGVNEKSFSGGGHVNTKTLSEHH